MMTAKKLDTSLSLLTLADVRCYGPCYDPATKVPESWTGTVLDILRLQNVSPEDRLWVVQNHLSDETLRLFGVWCARQALTLVESPDPRSLAACDVAERFARGEATSEELDAAAAAGETAAADAAWSAAWSAAAAAATAAAQKVARCCGAGSRALPPPPPTPPGPLKSLTSSKWSRAARGDAMWRSP